MPSDVFGAFDREQWLFVGDSGNDAAAFDAFAFSIGVANVRDHDLAVRPRFVTQADRGQGFAEVARHLLDSVGSAS